MQQVFTAFDELIIEASAKIVFDLRSENIEPSPDAIALLIADRLRPRIAAIVAQHIEVLDAIENAAVS